MYIISSAYDYVAHMVQDGMICITRDSYLYALR